MFIDSAKISVKAGNGGNGAVSFHREKYVAKGGPDGGDGGHGGNIIFIADENIRTLADFRYKTHYTADSGVDGGSCNCTGASAEDLIIKIPVGTIVRDEASNALVADFLQHDQKVVVAKGGRGGAGNQHYATARRQVPSFAKAGEEGEEKTVSLELKLLADVGLIGFPNVGKSTILSKVSSARPKIANYHFTTLQPYLGVVVIEEGESFVIADIPGLIEGASQGLGLGHEFLKHVERTKLLIHVIDIAGTEGRDPVEDFAIINTELKEYNEALASKPQIIALNKTDLLQDQSNIERFMDAIKSKGYKIFDISAATHHGLRDLMLYADKTLRELPDSPMFNHEEDEVLYKASAEDEYTIRRENDVFIIEGKWIKRVVRSINFGNHESLQYFQRLLKRKGVTKALEKKGVQEGNIVRVGDYEFEYIK